MPGFRTRSAFASWSARLSGGAALAMFAYGPLVPKAPAPVCTQRATAGPVVYSPIVELRQYTTRRGKRDVLIGMFDADFVGPQEAAGIKVIGQFRNLDDPDKFVWVRGFSDMESRAAGLTAFYSGPVWRARRDSANATIVDNDNVLLLHPVHPESGFTLERDERPPADKAAASRGLVIATIYHLDPTDPKEHEFVQFFEQTVTPLLSKAGAPVIASFVPERSANTFPRLPVREGEHVFVWFSRFPSVEAYEQFTRSLAETPLWRDSVSVELSSRVREPQTLRLSPTARSLLHG